jgi:hypothetical protein
MRRGQNPEFQMGTNFLPSKRPLLKGHVYILSHTIMWSRPELFCSFLHPTCHHIHPIGRLQVTEEEEEQSGFLSLLVYSYKQIPIPAFTFHECTLQEYQWQMQQPAFRQLSLLPWILHKNLAITTVTLTCSFAIHCGNNAAFLYPVLSARSVNSIF